MSDAELVALRSDRRHALAAWLTTERAVYGLTTLAALFLRLFGLGLKPLSPAEAAQALPAYQAALGYPYQLAGVSPLLFGLQRWLFLPLGGGDGLARWWPALLAGAAPILFYALRDRLGRGGALAAAVLWAFSPLAVFISRLGLGYGLVPTLALALLACVNIATRPAQGNAPAPAVRSSLTWAAIVLGALLASAPGAYTVILVGLIAALLWPGTAAQLRGRLRSEARPVLMAGLLGLVLTATAFWSAPAGLAAAADLLGRWARGLAPAVVAGSGAYSPFEIVLRLLISEPLLLVFGLGGFALAWRRRARLGLLAGLAVAVGLLLSLVSGARHPGDLGLVVLGLILLAGPAVASALEAAWSWRADLDPWLLIALSLALLAGAAVSLPGYFGAGNSAQRAIYVGIGAGTLLLLVALWVVYGAWGSWRTVRAVVPALVLLVGTIWAFGQLNGLNYDMDPLRRAAVLVDEPGPGWPDLRSELRLLSALNGGGAREARVDLVLPAAEDDPLGPMLRWELRDHPALRTAAQAPADPAPLLIVPKELPGPASDRYSGAGFDLLEEWRPESLSGFEQWMRWIVYRQAATAPEWTRPAVLWADRSAMGAGAATTGQGIAPSPVQVPAQREAQPQ